MPQATDAERQRIEESRNGDKGLAALGSVSQRAAMGHRARGLQPLRYGLGLSHPRSGAQPGLSLGRGRHRRLQRQPAAPLLSMACGTAAIPSSRSGCSG